MSHLKNGSVVWVRLGQAWWPGTITTVSKCPPEFVEGLRKTPVAIVKFFHENEFQDVHKEEHILPYCCDRKEEFIRKGQSVNKNQSHGDVDLLAKFEADVVTAEKLTGGDMDILRSLVEEAGKRRIDYSDLGFGLPKPKKKRDEGVSRRSSDIGQAVVYKRSGGTRGGHRVVVEHQVRIMEQPERENPDDDLSCLNASSWFKCQQCGFTCSRVNVILWHNKAHIGKVYNYDSGIKLPGRRRRRPGAQRGGRDAKRKSKDRKGKENLDHSHTNGDIPGGNSKDLQDTQQILMDWDDEEDPDTGIGEPETPHSPGNKNDDSDDEYSDADDNYPPPQPRYERQPMPKAADLNSAFDALLAATPTQANLNTSSASTGTTNNYMNNDSDSDYSDWEKYYARDSGSSSDGEEEVEQESDIKSLCEGKPGDVAVASEAEMATGDSGAEVKARDSGAEVSAGYSGTEVAAGDSRAEVTARDLGAEVTAGDSGNSHVEDQNEEPHEVEQEHLVPASPPKSASPVRVSSPFQVPLSHSLTPEPETEAHSDPELEAQPKPEPKLEAQLELEVVTQPKPEADELVTQIEPEAQLEPEAERELATQPEPEAQPEPEHELVAQSEPETEHELVAQSEPETEHELVAQSEPETEHELVAQSEPETEPELVAQPEPEAQLELETEPELVAQPEPEAGPEPKEQEQESVKPEEDHMPPTPENPSNLSHSHEEPLEVEVPEEKMEIEEGVANPEYYEETCNEQQITETSQVEEECPMATEEVVYYEESTTEPMDLVTHPEEEVDLQPQNLKVVRDRTTSSPDRDMEQSTTPSFHYSKNSEKVQPDNANRIGRYFKEFSDTVVVKEEEVSTDTSGHFRTPRPAHGGSSPKHPHPVVEGPVPGSPARPGDLAGTSSSGTTYMLVAVDAHGNAVPTVPTPALSENGNDLVAVEATMEDGTTRTLYIDPAQLGPNVDLSNLMLHIDTSGQEHVIIPSSSDSEAPPTRLTPPAQFSPGRSYTRVEYESVTSPPASTQSHSHQHGNSDS